MTAPARESTAVARREDPAAVALRQKRETLRTKLARFEDSFAKVLPKHLTPERMTTLALVAATKTPKLLDCSPESIALSVMQISQWGLDIGRTAHLVPFKGQCTAIPDWKGLVQLMINARHVRDVQAHAVYANERFVARLGADPVLEHDPVWDISKRGEMIAVYAVAWLPMNRTTFEVMGKDEVEKIRRGSPRPDSDAWTKHYDEMAKKTVIRRLAKRMPQSAALTGALDADEDPNESLARYAAAVGIESRVGDSGTPLPALGTKGAAGQAMHGYDSTGDMERITPRAEIPDPMQEDFIDDRDLADEEEW